MALFGIVERLSAAGMGAALEEAARGCEVFGELAEIGRVVLVAARALDGRAASLLGWRLAAERGARSPSCFAPSRPMMSGRRRRRCRHGLPFGNVLGYRQCWRLLIAPGAEFVAKAARPRS